MDSSYRQIIHRILKEEIMSESAVARLLEWYRTWNDKLSQSIAEGDYAKVIDTHFRTGVYLLSALKNASKSFPDSEKSSKWVARQLLFVERFFCHHPKYIFCSEAKEYVEKNLQPH